MTSLRDKAREIKAAGAAERDDYTPDGAPKRLYSYWLERSETKRAGLIRVGARTENFCHFWRVVAIWAPLMFLMGVVKKVAPVAAFATLATGIGLFIWALIASGDVRGVVGVFLVIVAIAAYIIGGVLSGVSMATDPEDRDEPLMIQNQNFLWLAFVLTIPVAAIAYGLSSMFYNWNSDWEIYLKVGTLGAVGAVLLSAYVWSWIVNPLGTLIGTGITLGVVAAFLTFAISASFLEDYIKGRRSIRREKERDARYAFYDEHGMYPEEIVEPREPSKFWIAIGSFFSGVADFIILIAQVVRVNKWKICPTVTITKD